MALGGGGIDPRLIFLENMLQGQGRPQGQPNQNYGAGNPLLYGGTDPAAMGGQSVQQMQMPQHMPGPPPPGPGEQMMPGLPNQPGQMNLNEFLSPGGDMGGNEMEDMMSMFFGG